MSNVGNEFLNIPQELKLLLELVTIEDNDDLEKLENLNDRTNWDLFLELAFHHRLFPVLHYRLKKLNRMLIPESVMQAIFKEYKLNTFRMMHLCAQMEQISKVFHEASIPALFLKGPNLAKELYGDISLRTSSDIDILIPLDRLEEVDQMLMEDGFEKEEEIKSVLNDWKWRTHHIEYKHVKKNIKLEIHWRLHPGPAHNLDFHELWSRKVKSTITSQPVFLLGKEDLFIYLAMHGARHGWFRLRWLLDIHQMLELEKVDWELTLRLAKEYSNPYVCGQAIVLSSRLFQTKIPPEMEFVGQLTQSKTLAQKATYYFESMKNPHLEPIPLEMSIYNKKYMFSLLSKKQKIITLLSYFYPYPEDVQQLQLPKAFRFLYFPLRPLLWAWRKTRKRTIY